MLRKTMRIQASVSAWGAGMREVYRRLLTRSRGLLRRRINLAIRVLSVLAVRVLAFKLAHTPSQALDLFVCDAKNTGMLARGPVGFQFGLGESLLASSFFDAANVP